MLKSKFVLFAYIVSFVFLILDIYFLASWQRFAKSRKLNPLYYKLAWVFSILMVVFLYLLMINRLDNPAYTTYTYWGFILVSIWFLPKLILTPIIFIKDIIKGLFWMLNKIIPLKSKDSPDNIDLSSNPVSTSRRDAIKTSAWTLASVPFIIAGDGVLRTLYDFKVHRLELKLNNLPKALDGIKILQISDIHSGSFLNDKPMQEVLRLINIEKADLLFVTGDFVNFHPDELRVTHKQLSQLKADLGVWGCMGNHDHYMSDENHNLLMRSLEGFNIQMLTNENKVLNINNSKLNLAGTDNYGMNQWYGDFNKALTKIDEETSTILLCHDPRNWNQFITDKRKVDLMLAGHTHGGQVAFELGSLDLSPAKFAYKQYAGLYKENNQYLYVNRGLGTTGPPVRIGVNPEITVITLRS